MDLILHEQDSPIVALTMNGPEKRNARPGTAVQVFVAAIDCIHDALFEKHPRMFE